MKACAGEGTRVVPLPPSPLPRESKRHHRSLCATEANRTCDWLGPLIAGALHSTHMHTLESAVFNRFVECSVESEKAATLHLIPYPATDLMISYQGTPFGDADRRMQAHHEAVKATLARSWAWRRCGGCDHVLVVSRSAADYPQSCPWGCGLIDVDTYKPPTFPPRLAHFPPMLWQFRLDDPFWANVSILTQEQIPPAHLALSNVFPMARPTSLHPQTPSELHEWQRRLSRTPRDRLMTLAAAYKGHRVHLFDACKARPDVCHFIDCRARVGKHGACYEQFLYEEYSRSKYCLMPFGDTPSRRAIFDALVCGCIPVVYHRFSFYWPWHVPNRSAAALLIPTPSPWSRAQPRHLALLTSMLTSLREVAHRAFGRPGTGEPTPPLQPWRGEPGETADGVTQTFQNAFSRTLAAITSRGNATEEAQRRYLIWQLLPRIVYHYGDGEADDAVTLALREIRARVNLQQAIVHRQRKPRKATAPAPEPEEAAAMKGKRREAARSRRPPLL